MRARDAECYSRKVRGPKTLGTAKTFLGDRMSSEANATNTPAGHVTESEGLGARRALFEA